MTVRSFVVNPKTKKKKENKRGERERERERPQKSTFRGSMNNVKRNEEELEKAKTQAILSHLPAEEVAKKWFRAVTDGNEAKVAELLAAHPAVTVLSCVAETTTSPEAMGSAVLMNLRRSSLVGCCF